MEDELGSSVSGGATQRSRTDADTVLLDLLGTYVLLDGGSEKVVFTKHVRQIDANIISAPTRAALTNAVELNKGAVVPLVGNIPNVKSTGSNGSVSSLLKCIEKASEDRPAITPTRFNPKYDPIVISKSLRTGCLQLIVLAGEAKEIEALQKAVESGDEQMIEKVASNNGTISVLVWFPAKATDPIKRVLHTGTAPLSRIVAALEKAKALPYLHSPVVSAANAYKEVPAPKTTNARTTIPPRGVPVKPANNTAAPKLPAARRPVPAASSHVPPSRPTTTTSNKSAPTSGKPSPARPAAAAPTRTRPASTVTTKPAPLANKNSTLSTAKRTNNHEPAIQKTTVGPLKGAAMSRASAAAGKVIGAVTGKITPNNKASGNVSPQKNEPSAPDATSATSNIVDSPPAPDAGSVAADAPPPAPNSATTPEEVKEPAPTPAEPTPSLDDSVICLDDVVPDISIDAPQDPASSDLRPPVELVVIPPTPEPRSPSARSSIDGTLSSPIGSQKCDGEKDQPVLVSEGDDQRTKADVPSPTATTTPTLPHDQNLASEHDHIIHPVPDQPEHDSDLDRNDASSEHPVPTAPERSPSPELDINHEPLPGDTKPTPHNEEVPKIAEPLPDKPVEPFIPPIIRRPSPTSSEVLLEGELPEEFKGPHVPQEVGENGLLDDLEEPPKLMKISMDTDDLKNALEKGAAAVADQLAQCFDSLSLNTSHSEKEDASDKTSEKASPEGQAEIARKISAQMIQDASTPFTSALASTLFEGAEAAKKAANAALEDIADLANAVSETVTDGMKEAAEQVNDKMKAMQNRSSLVEVDGEEHRQVKYEETDPIIDTVLESVANDSDRVDHAMSNGGSGIQAKENGKKENEASLFSSLPCILIRIMSGSEIPVDEEGFRVASDSHDMRLYLPPPSALRGRAPAVPHLSRPLFFELATVPHFNAHKTRLIPTRHHSALQSFVTENAAQLEECGLVLNSALEHNTISINTEEGREDYHMIKIEL
ncbi:hypothetical protein NECAME_00700 [Necator americanus]|uniref:Uncharacterized protein n=1 Tax=Necator americanus TaxID=51031 RepID=W2SVP3_NECAM|nr:hypothetical protein NECAME_00700 [Necator americanus]ETN73613.1 hypothetical protein NECAME_00700 [Necator americanus]